MPQDGPVLLKLCTALLLTNKLSKDQINHVKVMATKAVEGSWWETVKVCTEYIDATAQDIKANEKWVELHDSNGTEGTFEHIQTIASFTSASEGLQMGIRMAVEAGGEAYGGKVSAESSLEKSYNTAWSVSKERSMKQKFTFEKGEREILCQKVYFVKQGGTSREFFVDVQRFNLEDFSAKTGLTPK